MFVQWTAISVPVDIRLRLNQRQLRLRVKGPPSLVMAYLGDEKRTRPGGFLEAEKKVEFLGF